jgi:hypothetical protein
MEIERRKQQQFHSFAYYGALDITVRVSIIRGTHHVGGRNSDGEQQQFGDITDIAAPKQAYASLNEER